MSLTQLLSHPLSGRLPFWMMVAGAAMLLGVGCLGQQGEASIEEVAQGINRSLMCPVCPSETIDQSRVELAQQMRDLVVEMLEQGRSKEEIRDFFVSRYGEDVLAAPPKSGFNILIWIVPVLALPIVVTTLVMVLRNMRRRRGDPAEGSLASSGSEEDLKPYLVRVDEEMGKVLGEPAPDNTPLRNIDEGGGS